MRLKIEQMTFIVFLFPIIDITGEEKHVMIKTLICGTGSFINSNQLVCIVSTYEVL